MDRCQRPRSLPSSSAGPEAQVESGLSSSMGSARSASSSASAAASCASRSRRRSSCGPGCATRVTIRSRGGPGARRVRSQDRTVRVGLAWVRRTASAGRRDRLRMFALPPESLIAQSARLPVGRGGSAADRRVRGRARLLRPGAQVATGMPASAAAASCDLTAAEGMPVMPMASGLRWIADSSPAPGSGALNTRLSYFHPTAAVASLTPGRDLPADRQLALQPEERLALLGHRVQRLLDRNLGGPGRPRPRHGRRLLRGGGH
jgi:hypothetical protein